MSVDREVHATAGREASDTYPAKSGILSTSGESLYTYGRNVLAFHAFGKVPGEFFHIATQIVLLKDALSPIAGKALAQSGIIHQFCQGLDQRIQIGRRNQQTVGAISD